MLKIATVFSGIGAPEEAIKQLGIEHKIVFACDNGERYTTITEQDITEYINKNPKKSVQDVVKEAYDSTKKPNYVKKTYFANYEIKEEDWYEDIRFLNGIPYKNQVDLLVGGSPCQTFSTYGNRKGLEDTRGTLFYDYARLIKETQPKAFIFENVTGLLNHDHGKTWEVIQGTFQELNYDIKMQVLNAQDYNLPQLRRRVFVVGINKSLGLEEFEFPKKVKLEHKSSEYLETNIPIKYYLGEKGFNFVTKVERNQRRARVNQDIIGCQTANQQFNWVGDFRVEDPKPEHYKDPRVFVGEYNGKLAVARQLTPRETLRLMGFSDDFKIVTEDNVMWRQCGNSIAVPVMKEIIKNIIKIIGE